MNQLNRTTSCDSAIINSFERRLDSFGWGVILILSGAMWLAPKGLLPEGSWFLSVGLVLVGLNAARYSFHREWNGWSTAVGVLALLAGTGALLHVNVPFFGITLIVIGLLGLLLPERAGDSSVPAAPRNCCEL